MSLDRESVDRESAVSAHRTVSRVAAILELAATCPDEGVRLKSLAEGIDAPKSSIHGLAKGLVAIGYLTERSGGAYVLGPAVRALLGTSSQTPDWEVALPRLDRLRDLLDETVMLGQLVGGHVVYVAGAESRQPIRYSAALNQRRPLLPTSMGKVFVADKDEATTRSLIEAHTEDPAERERMFAELAAVRRSGVAVNRDETVAGLCGVAASIRRGGALVFALSVVGPTNRLAPRLAQIRGALKDAADDIASLL